MKNEQRKEARRINNSINLPFPGSNHLWFEYQLYPYPVPATQREHTLIILMKDSVLLKKEFIYIRAMLSRILQGLQIIHNWNIPS